MEVEDSLPLLTFDLICFVLLIAWFTLDFFGVPGLVARDPLLSLAGLLEAALLIVLGLTILLPGVGAVMRMLLLSLWAYLQYDSHWRGFFFGATEQRRAAYARMFGRMRRVLPPLTARLVPDAYHTVLGALILVNLAVAAVQVTALARG